MTRINIPDGVEYIGEAAFRDCASLEKVVLPPNIKVLSEAIFRGCKKLKECIVPYGVTELGEAVFNGCESVERIVLPETVKKMTEGGFFGCKNLKYLQIPVDIEGLDIRSFETCPYVSVIAGGFRYINGKGVTEQIASKNLSDTMPQIEQKACIPIDMGKTKFARNYNQILWKEDGSYLQGDIYNKYR